MFTLKPMQNLNSIEFNRTILSVTDGGHKTHRPQHGRQYTPIKDLCLRDEQTDCSSHTSYL